MKYTAEMGSGAMTLHAKFHKYWFRHPKVCSGRLTDTQHGYHISLISFSQNKHSRLKIVSVMTSTTMTRRTE
jgi:hypothetical protein